MSTTVPDAPPPSLRYRHHVRLGRSLAELWAARELVVTLAEREFRVRYKQAYLGVAWALFIPLALMTIFSLTVDRVADIDTDGAPYVLFAYLGLLPWTSFSSSISKGAESLLSNKALLNKVYCPREIFPLSSVSVAVVDTALAASVLAVLFLVTGTLPAATSVWVPVIVAVQLAFTLGAALVISIVTVYVRDLRQVVPIALQLGLFATPVAYGIDDFISEGALPLYAFLNPLAPVIDAYRSAVLLGEVPRLDLLAVAGAAGLVWLCGGYLLFKRLEAGVADVA